VKKKEILSSKRSSSLLIGAFSRTRGRERISPGGGESRGHQKKRGGEKREQTSRQEKKGLVQGLAILDADVVAKDSERISRSPRPCEDIGCRRREHFWGGGRKRPIISLKGEKREYLERRERIMGEGRLEREGLLSGRAGLS